VTTAAVETMDGRRARGIESRRKIVTAMMELVRAGNINPRAEDVAAKADVGLRTVFRHFDDMDSLYVEMNLILRAEIDPIVNAPFPEGGWSARLDDVLRRRSTVFDRIMPLKLSAEAFRWRSAVLTAQHVANVAEERAALMRAVPAGRENETAVISGLELILSFDSWRRLRRDQGLSAADAKAVWSMAARAITAHWN